MALGLCSRRDDSLLKILEKHVYHDWGQELKRPGISSSAASLFSCDVIVRQGSLDRFAPIPMWGGKGYSRATFLPLSYFPFTVLIANYFPFTVLGAFPVHRSQ